MEKSERKKRKKLNSEIMTTTIIFALIFFVMIGYYVYFLVVESHDVVNNDYNKRIDGYAETVEEAIFSADGDKLAYTKTDDAGNETENIHMMNYFLM